MERDPSRPALFPAIDISWQGEPNVIISTGGISAPFMLQMLPRCFTSGIRVLVTSIGNGSISDKNYEELNGNQLAYVTRKCEDLYNSVNDFLAYKIASDFSKLNYLPYDNGIRFLVESCSPGISHNKFLFRDGINDEIVEEYNRFVRERNL